MYILIYTIIGEECCFKEILDNLYVRYFAEYGYLWYKSYDRS